MRNPAKMPAYSTVSWNLSDLSIGFQHVADSTQRVDQAGFDFPVHLVAQLVDEDFDDVALPVEGVAPHVLGDQRLAQDAALVAEEVLEQGELPGRELDFRVSPVDLALEQV